MHWLQYIATLLPLLSIEQMMASASEATLVVEQAPVPCDNLNKYSTGWFLDNVRTRPALSQCLLYSAGLSGRAQKMTRPARKDKISIWNVWDCGLYDSSQSEKNPLRCIMKKLPNGNFDKDATTYFEHMSLALAQICGGFVTSIHTNQNNIDRNGIFWRVERASLMGPRTRNMPKVAMLNATDVNGRNPVTLFRNPTKRDLISSLGEESSMNVFEKRAECPDVDPAFDKIPW